METLQRTANRGSISTGFDIANSVKLEPDNAEFLKRNQADGNRKTWTYSMWVKRTELGMSNGMLLFYAGVYHQATRIFFDAGSDMDKLTIDLASEATTQYRWITKRLFRDTSAWYHFVWRVDTTQSTATDRMRMYVNGVLLTADDFEQTATFPQNTDTTANKSSLGGQQQMAIGNYSWANNDGIYAGYAAQCALVDGESLAPTEFGEFDEDTGIWKPKDISGLNYGTGNNSFFLDFETASDLGANAKGNDVNFTLNNITAADQATDTPTNNFCTMNPVMLTAANTVISQGATSLFSTGASGNTVVGTIGVSRGKWYWEFKDINHGGTAYWPAIGYTSSESTDSTQTAGGGSGYPSHVALLPNGGTFSNGTIFSGKFNTFSPNDIAGVALDMDNGNMYLYKNGTIQNSGNPIFTSIGDFAMPVGSVYLNPCGGYFNFGGFTSYTPASPASDENGYGTFEYAPPSGYYALCTKNLAEYG